ncbi:DUF5361 domain-containing protein [Nocardia sp. NPDC049149]|uniref:DUF5361 domain-containing protein n=1 Tax=Nocardia sp. NPDC049149 TaxID=3364315 RepID=UPI0037194D55
MARALRDRAGGILSLAALIDEHTQAIELDLIDHGMRLRDLGDTVTWTDLRAVVYQAENTALRREISPDHQWGLTEMLLADIADSLRWLKWAKTTDAQRKRNIPRPIPRPGVKAPERIGAPLSVAEMNKFLGWEVA